MRIDKRVERLLKVKITTGLSMFDLLANVGIKDTYLSSEEQNEFDRWFRMSMTELLSDPVLDTVAASYGLKAWDVLETLEVRGELKATAEFPGERNEVAASYNPTRHRLYLRVPKWYMEENVLAELNNSFIHEFDHAARETAIGLGENPYKGLPMKEKVWYAITDPREVSALEAQVLELVTMGYTDEQIIALLLDKFAEGEGEGVVEEPWQRQLFVAYEHQLNDLLRQVRENYREFV